MKKSMLARVLKALDTDPDVAEEDQSSLPQVPHTIRELLKTSMQFEEAPQSDDEDLFSPADDIHYPEIDLKPRQMLTFSELLAQQKCNPPNTQSSSKKSHVRGPSKIKEILNDLQTNLQEEFKKLTTYMSDSDQKSYQDFQEPCQQERKPKKRRKQARYPRGYCLDIIEEQSNDHLTPERSLVNLDSPMDTIHSVPCFGDCSRVSIEYHSQAKHTHYEEEHEHEHERYCPDSLEFHSEVNPLRLNELMLDHHRIRTYRSHNREEEMILASWNRLCSEIIRKNLLPVSLNIEMIQNQYDYQSNSSKRYQLVKYPKSQESDCMVVTGEQSPLYSPKENKRKICKRIQFTRGSSSSQPRGQLRS